MTRRISPQSGILFSLFPYIGHDRDRRRDHVAPDDRRPTPTGRRPGWSAERRRRYHGKEAPE